jgi:hypothetical protein
MGHHFRPGADSDRADERERLPRLRGEGRSRARELLQHWRLVQSRPMAEAALSGLSLVLEEVVPVDHEARRAAAPPLATMRALDGERVGEPTELK